MIDYSQPHWRGVMRPQPGMTQAQYLDALRQSRREADRERKHKRTMTAVNVGGFIFLLLAVGYASLTVRYSVMQETAAKCTKDHSWCVSIATGGILK